MAYKTTQPKLPHIARGRQSNAPKISEDVLQTHVMGALRTRGYIVLSTVHRYKKQRCPKCAQQFWAQGGYGATPGVPDLIVSHADWPSGMWVGLELKGTQTVLSPAQKQLREQDRIFIVRTVDQALSIVESYCDEEVEEETKTDA